MAKKHSKKLRRMAKALVYTVFSTKWGYFGLAGTPTSRGSLVRTHLPMGNCNRVVQNLLAGLGPAEFNAHYLIQLQQRIKAYYQGTCVDRFTDVRVDLRRLSPFTAAVLRACRKIRPGRTISYAQLAKMAGFPQAARAAGKALAANPLPLIIPCHRCICSNPDKSGLGGFTAPEGTSLKRRMLEFESRCIGMTENQIA
jgi:methylated-DNA-[protein]-cysteine S-methyltransferase